MQYAYGFSILIIWQISCSYAIDLQPGEIYAPKPGLKVVQLAYQYSERGDRYLHGTKQSGDPAIHNSQVQIRLGRSFEIGKYPAFFYAQTPLGYVHPKGSLSHLAGDSGVGDTVLMQALWPYANRETQTYIGIAAYLFIPTGDYRSERNFNNGENRYRWALQAGYQAPLTQQLHWMVAVDANWFGENDDFGRRHETLSRRVLYAGQYGLRYNFNEHYALGATYFQTVGGETRVNGLGRQDRVQLHRYQLSGIARFSFGNITLQYGNDLKTENGYLEERRWILRYSKSF